MLWLLGDGSVGWGNTIQKSNLLLVDEKLIACFHGDKWSPWRPDGQVVQCGLGTYSS